MKSRIDKLFEKKPSCVLNVYCTAGFPSVDNTLDVMRALQEHGADMIELGMPYSDPLADGPVIQQSASNAIANGMSIPKLFEQLGGFRKEIHIPVILMGYLNPVLQFGFEEFCAKAAELGIDGLIIPDLPQYDFEKTYGAILKKFELDFIFLVTPETAMERVRVLDKLSTGFIYAVSSSSTTGLDKDFSSVASYLSRLRSMGLRNPVLVGFGVKDRGSFELACRHANGAIVGSAYIKALSAGENISTTTADFLRKLKG